MVRYLRMLILLRRGARHGSFVKIAETLSVTSATFNFCIYKSPLRLQLSRTYPGFHREHGKISSLCQKALKGKGGLQQDGRRGRARAQLENAWREIENKHVPTPSMHTHTHASLNSHWTLKSETELLWKPLPTFLLLSFFCLLHFWVFFGLGSGVLFFTFLRRKRKSANCVCACDLGSSGRASCQKPTPASIFLVPGEDFINIWEVGWDGAGGDSWGEWRLQEGGQITFGPTRHRSFESLLFISIA